MGKFKMLRQRKFRINPLIHSFIRSCIGLVFFRRLVGWLFYSLFDWHLALLPFLSHAVLGFQSEWLRALVPKITVPKPFEMIPIHCMLQTYSTTTRADMKTFVCLSVFTCTPSLPSPLPSPPLPPNDQGARNMPYMKYQPGSACDGGQNFRRWILVFAIRVCQWQGRCGNKL